MKLDELTIGEVKELMCLVGGKDQKCDHPYHVGELYFIRTVTHYFTGKLIKVTPMELVLTDAAWIPDTGRWSEALEKGSLNEVEPYPSGEVIVGRGAVIDAVLWQHKAPKTVK